MANPLIMLLAVKSIKDKKEGTIKVKGSSITDTLFTGERRAKTSKSGSKEADAIADALKIGGAVSSVAGGGAVAGMGAAMDPSGLPATLPVGTVIRNTAGTTITTSSLMNTAALLKTLPPGTLIITPNGIQYKKPGAVATQPLQPTGTPANAAGLTTDQQLLLAGLQAAPALVPLATEAIGDIFSGIGSGVSSFIDWLGGDSGTSSTGSELSAESLFGGMDDAPATGLFF